MFTRVLALLPFALLASAATLEARGECATGPAQCCTQTTKDALIAKYNNDASLISVLANVLGTDNTFSDCSGGAVGVANTCSAQQQPVCCKDNVFSGLVGVNCSPITVIV